MNGKQNESPHPVFILDQDSNLQIDLYTNANPVQGESADIAGLYEVNERAVENNQKSIQRH